MERLDQLEREMGRRFDRLEEKFDVFQSELVRQETDLRWVKGFIKWSATAISAAVAGLLSILFSSKGA